MLCFSSGLPCVSPPMWLLIIHDSPHYSVCVCVGPWSSSWSSLFLLLLLMFIPEYFQPVFVFHVRPWMLDSHTLVFWGDLFVLFGRPHLLSTFAFLLTPFSFCCQLNCRAAGAQSIYFRVQAPVLFVSLFARVLHSSVTPQQSQDLLMRRSFTSIAFIFIFSYKCNNQPPNRWTVTSIYRDRSMQLILIILHCSIIYTSFYNLYIRGFGIGS